MKFNFLIIFNSLLILSSSLPRINSVGERVKEVAFSLLNLFMTSEKNNLLKKLYDVKIIRREL